MYVPYATIQQVADAMTDAGAEGQNKLVAATELLKTLGVTQMDDVSRAIRLARWEIVERRNRNVPE